MMAEIPQLHTSREPTPRESALWVAMTLTKGISRKALSSLIRSHNFCAPAIWEELQALAAASPSKGRAQIRLPDLGKVENLIADWQRSSARLLTLDAQDYPPQLLDLEELAPVLYLRPRTICAGIGCKRNMDADSIRDALLATLKKEGLSPLSLKCISTIPLKADEPGILATARQLGVPLTVIPTADIEALDITGLGIQTSGFVAKQTGVLSVSTASAYLASGKGRILRDKEKYKGITIALCQSEEKRG